MLEAGIQEKVKLGSDVKVTTDTEGKAVLNIQLIKDGELDTLDSLMSEDEYVPKDMCIIKRFIPTAKKFNSDEYNSLDNLVKSLKTEESLLKGFLRMYLTEDKLTGKIGGKRNFEGIDEEITKDNLEAILQNDRNLQIIYTNLFNDFYNLYVEHNLSTVDTSFTVKLPRGAKNNFPTLTYDTRTVWIEPTGTMPTKIAWTKYEKEKHLNEYLVVDTDKVPEEVVNTASEMFPKNEIDEVFVD